MEATLPQEKESKAVLYSLPTVSEITDISGPTFYRLWEAGVGPDFVKIGRRRLVPRDALFSWIKDLPNLDIEGALRALREKKAMEA